MVVYKHFGNCAKLLAAAEAAALEFLTILRGEGWGVRRGVN